MDVFLQNNRNNIVLNAYRDRLGPRTRHLLICGGDNWYLLLRKNIKPRKNLRFSRSVGCEWSAYLKYALMMMMHANEIDSMNSDFFVNGKSDSLFSSERKIKNIENIMNTLFLPKKADQKCQIEFPWIVTCTAAQHLFSIYYVI